MVPSSSTSPLSFLSHLIHLVELELSAEESQSTLLLSSSPLSLLQRSGLALLNLSPSFSVGLGGKQLVELTRSNAWHTDNRFGPHDFRVGDLARIELTGGGEKKGISKGKEKEGTEGRDAVVYKVGNEKIVLVLQEDKNEEESGILEWAEKVNILKVATPSTFTRQIFFLRKAIRLFEACEGSGGGGESAAPSPLLSVLLGLSDPTLNKEDPALKQANLKWFDEGLNESQREAVEFCLRSNEVGMVWGPPGTGKTQTLVELIRQLVLNQQLRVLVCGASNLSVDNILLRLSQPCPTSSTPIPPIPLTRLGHPARILSSLTSHTLDAQSSLTDASSLVQDIKSDLLLLNEELANRDKKTRLKGSERKKKWDEVKELRKDMRRRMGGVEKEVLGGKLIVLGTTHGAGGKVLDREQEYDVVIIDEAAQATEPACWIPIMRGKKLILAGDHLQLPPTLKSVSSSSTSSSSSSFSYSSNPTPLTLSHTLETTLFSRLLRLHGEKLRKMLKVQYRFNSKINEFPSKTLYGSELVPDETVMERKLGDLLEDEDGGGGGEDEEDLNEQVVFFDTAGLAMYERSAEEGSGYGSESKSNENEAEIVLNYVKFLIKARIPTSSISIISPYSSQVLLLSSLIHPLYPEIEIGSIDSNQGRENDVIIISLVRSNESGEIGFLKEMRRLNVAMTRARRQLVVVGDSETLRKGGEPSSSTKKKGKEKKGKSQQEGEEEESDEKMNGARFVKEWMDWLEVNAYVRTPEDL
ncbi:hypothetical protein JCM5353_001026 [Sporobolomyces roseus]